MPGLRARRCRAGRQPGVADCDPLRIVLDVRGTGRSGYEVADALRQAYDVQPELATQATVVLVVGIGERADALERMAGDIDEIVKRIAATGGHRADPRAAPARSAARWSWRRGEAFLGVGEVVAVDDAVGRVSCESIAGYPPGIPALLPGERVTAETVAYLRGIVAAGARLHGAADPTFETINVLAARRWNATYAGHRCSSRVVRSALARGPRVQRRRDDARDGPRGRPRRGDDHAEGGRA